MTAETRAMSAAPTTSDRTPDVICLGGLPVGLPASGAESTTLPGRLYRGAAHTLVAPDAAGALAAAGVRTVVDLRNAGEGVRYELPGTVAVHVCPVEDPADADFARAFGPHLGSPRHYPEVVRRWPDRLAAAVATVARAPEGGVLVHCAAGRDRTGQVVAVLLTLAGVGAEAVADQDAEARRRANTSLRSHPRPQEVALDDTALEVRLAQDREELLAFLAGTDLGAALGEAGLTSDDVQAVRRRLVVA